MAKDVDQALRTIAQQEGSMSEDDAGVWVKGFRRKDATLRMYTDFAFFH